MSIVKLVSLQGLLSALLLVNSCKGGSSSPATTPASAGTTSTFTVNATGTSVTISPATAQQIAPGAMATFAVTASTSGGTVSTSVGGSCASGSWSGSHYSTGAVTSNCTATFSATGTTSTTSGSGTSTSTTSTTTYTVTASGTYVTISPSAAQTVSAKATQAFTVTASSGYTLSTTVGGTCATGTWSGSIYTTGAIVSSCTVTFAAVSDSTGLAIDAYTITTVQPTSVSALAVDSSSNLYTAGVVTGSGTLNFGNGVTVAVPATGGYVAKFNSAGNALWAALATCCSSTMTISGLAVDSTSGNVFIGGYTSGSGTFSFGNSVNMVATNSGSGTYNAFVAMFNSTGLAQWATPATGASANFYSLDLDATGAPVVAGAFGSGTVNLGNSITAVSLNATTNPLLARFNTSGVAQWLSTAVTSSSTASFGAVAGASDGSLYAAGYLNSNGTFSFGNSVVAQGAVISTSNAVLLKYNASGVAQWAANYSTGTSPTVFNSVKADTTTGVVVVGTVGAGSSSLGSGVSVVGESFFNEIAAKFNTAGVPQWAQAPTSTGITQAVFSAAVDSSGDTYVDVGITGAHTLNFGNSVTATTTYSGLNAVLLKLNATGVPQWAQVATNGTSTSTFRAVAVDNANSVVYAGGALSGTSTYDFGSLTATGSGTSSTGTNAVWVKYNQ